MHGCGMPDEKQPRFPVRVSHWMSTYDGQDSYWATLCIVYDSIALGVLLRALDMLNISHKEEPT